MHCGNDIMLGLAGLGHGATVRMFAMCTGTSMQSSNKLRHVQLKLRGGGKLPHQKVAPRRAAVTPRWSKARHSEEALPNMPPAVLRESGLARPGGGKGSSSGSKRQHKNQTVHLGYQQRQSARLFIFILIQNNYKANVAGCSGLGSSGERWAALVVQIWGATEELWGGCCSSDGGAERPSDANTGRPAEHHATQTCQVSP